MQLPGDYSAARKFLKTYVKVMHQRAMKETLNTWREQKDASIIAMADMVESNHRDQQSPVLTQPVEAEQDMKVKRGLMGNGKDLLRVAGISLQELQDALAWKGPFLVQPLPFDCVIGAMY